MILFSPSFCNEKQSTKEWMNFIAKSKFRILDYDSRILSN